jgi:hypothetical protein
MQRLKNRVNLLLGHLFSPLSTDSVTKKELLISPHVDFSFDIKYIRICYTAA